MSWGGYIPGDLLNDPKFLETFEPYLPGMELVDEDEGEATEVSPPPPPTTIYRVVDEKNAKRKSYDGQHFYVTASAARGQATKLNKAKWLKSGPFRAQRVLVNESDWEDI